MPSFSEVNGRTVGRGIVTLLCAALVAFLLVSGGCSKESEPQDQQPGVTPGAGAGSSEFCDFKGGPDDAPVKVVAFYPGRHEDTLDAINSLLDTFKDKVQVEIVDWRREQGMARRNAAGLVCAAVTINGKNAFTLDDGGQERKVLFVRGIEGEWTRADLEAAVRQELQGAEGN